jgi:hypothetical protein
VMATVRSTPAQQHASKRSCKVHPGLSSVSLACLTSLASCLSVVVHRHVLDLSIRFRADRTSSCYPSGWGAQYLLCSALPGPLW